MIRMETEKKAYMLSSAMGVFQMQTPWRSHTATESKQLRWLDTVFEGQYLPSLSVNYVAINKDLENLTPQLY